MTGIEATIIVFQVLYLTCNATYPTCNERNAVNLRQGPIFSREMDCNGIVVFQSIGQSDEVTGRYYVKASCKKREIENYDAVYIQKK